MNTPNQENLDEARQRKIQELEEALKDPNNGTPTCRVIARHTLKVLKQRPLMGLDKQNF